MSNIYFSDANHYKDEQIINMFLKKFDYVSYLPYPEVASFLRATLYFCTQP